MEEIYSSEKFQDEDEYDQDENEYEVMKVQQLIINDISKCLKFCNEEGTKSITNGSEKKRQQHLKMGEGIQTD